MRARRRIVLQVGLSTVFAFPLAFGFYPADENEGDEYEIILFCISISLEFAGGLAR